MKPIPRANTQKNVNQVVYNSIEARLKSDTRDQVLVDAPCGDGEFAQYLLSVFPELKVIGVDLFAEASNKGFEFKKMSAHDFFRQQKPKSIDLITCISGVMCFDGIAELMEKFYASLKPKGMLVLTNDNIMTVRDRLSFLFFGRFKRFKLLYAKNEGNWNIVLPQALMAQLQRNGFQNIRVQYTSVYTEDLLFLPLAFFIYPIFLLNLIFTKAEMSIRERRDLFPFKMLISRHYIVVAEKSSEGPQGIE